VIDRSIDRYCRDKGKNAPAENANSSSKKLGVMDITLLGKTHVDEPLNGLAQNAPTGVQCVGIEGTAVQFSARDRENKLLICRNAIPQPIFAKFGGPRDPNDFIDYVKFYCDRFEGFCYARRQTWPSPKHNQHGP
jgi:hypothetical protein